MQENKFEEWSQQENQKLTNYSSYHEKGKGPTNLEYTTQPWNERRTYGTFIFYQEL